MMQITGLSERYASLPIQPPSTGLEAQLKRLEKELSACVNCASAITSEGKKKIQDVANKIGLVKSRLDTATTQPRRGAEGKEVSDVRQSHVTDPAQNNAGRYEATQALTGGIISIHA
jgi:hypothetical protein